MKTGRDGTHQLLAVRRQLQLLHRQVIQLLDFKMIINELTLQMKERKTNKKEGGVPSTTCTAMRDKNESKAVEHRDK